MATTMFPGKARTFGVHCGSVTDAHSLQDKGQDERVLNGTAPQPRPIDREHSSPTLRSEDLNSGNISGRRTDLRAAPHDGPPQLERK